MTTAEEIHIEVVYALPTKQVLLQICLPQGATVDMAIRCSGILTQFPEIDLARNKVGIFSKLVKLDETVRDRDRVEIYRPLIAGNCANRPERRIASSTVAAGASKTSSNTC